MKKTLSILMSVLIAMLMTVALSANMFASAFENGNGTSNDPYKIFNADDFMELVEASEYDSFENEYFVLENNISVSEGYIGNEDTPFMGNFNGNGKTVTFTNDDFTGMFRCVEDATVENLNVTGKLFVEDGSDEDGIGVAGIVGTAFGRTTIDNCTFKGSATNQGVKKNYMAGICGYGSGNLTISGCINYANLEGNGTYIAGILGYFTKGFVSVKNCMNYGEVLGNSFIAGIIGNVLDSGFSVNHCINAGKIDSYMYAGGILNAKNTKDKTNEMSVMNCINRGIVCSDDKNGRVAGIAGYIEDSVKDFSVINCANFGKIQGTDRNGGILASWSSQTGLKLIMKNCYNGGTIIGTTKDALIGYYVKNSADVITTNFFDSTICATTLSNLGLATAADTVEEAVAKLNESVNNSGWFEWSVGYVNAKGELVASQESGAVAQAVFTKDIPVSQGSGIGSVLSEGNLWVIIVVAVAAIAAVAVLVVVKKKKTVITAADDND